VTLPRYAPIESYAIIGDLQTAALVGLDGSIDFLCLPHFDSPSVFAALLDAERGGRFAVHPILDGVRQKQLYLPDTNVLLTRFLSHDGVAEISDFMPVHPAPAPSRIVRRVKTVRGTVTFRLRCAPRFDYGRVGHTATLVDGGAQFLAADGGAGEPVALHLTTAVPLALDGGDVVAEFTLREGESTAFVLEQEIGPDALQPGIAERPAVAQAFKDTVNYWRGWIAGSTYTGRWRDEVHRSALALKLLHSRVTGAIVAAPTFGLPEEVGGVRNWDYRYTWIRDASFTLYALIRLGLTDESRDFIGWLVRPGGPLDDPDGLHTLYTLEGTSVPAEVELSHFEGYRGSTPVRVGNEARTQLQLDIFGELVDALYLYDKYAEPTSYDLWLRIRGVVDWVAGHWRLPDEGIWEIRADRREHLYSRVLCWVAMDRGIRLAVKRSLPAPLARWIEERDAIYASVFEDFWDPALEAFVGARAAPGEGRLDASCLLMPLVRFISPTDPRWLSTLRAVERRLVSDSLVFRYEIEGLATDGLPGEEGTFSMCSFWFIECLSRAGDVEKARFLFEKMLGYANHVGLYAEQVGRSGEHLGNFPQAFTHLALISAAFDLDRRLSGKPWLA
jgi:GH15 family glucan-1,4-alpha-glucosidase